MFITFPKEIQELMDICEPFFVNHVFTNPTPEAQAAFDKVCELLDDWGQ